MQNQGSIELVSTKKISDINGQKVYSSNQEIAQVNFNSIAMSNRVPSGERNPGRSMGETQRFLLVIT